MILGLFWFTGFPDGIYEFEYFRFERGYGGHGDTPARLLAEIETVCPGQVLEEIRSLHVKYGMRLISYYQEGSWVQIRLTDYYLYDFDFLFAREVETVFRKWKVFPSQRQKSLFSVQKAFGDSVGYPESMALRPELVYFFHSQEKILSNVWRVSLGVNCHVATGRKECLINELDRIAEDEGIDIFYYYERIVGDWINLVMVFTNGRQGLDLKMMKDVNTLAFENRIRHLFESCHAIAGEIEGEEKYLVKEKKYVVRSGII